jgi:hypothetical protein
MSLTELKETITELSAEDRREIAAHLAHLGQVDDSDYQAELDRRMSRMDAGQKISAETLEKLHQSLLDQGK